MQPLIVLFLVVFVLNTVPAFAPPTWFVFSFIGFQFPSFKGAEVAIVGAVAATLGRVTLAKLSRLIIRQKFLSDETRRNIDSIKDGLQGRKKLTFGVALFYAFSPLPSNYLFIAYGLTTMNLALIAVPFFLGRVISYSFWNITSSAVARRISIDSGDAFPYLSAYFIVSQIVFLYLVYLFTRIDWRKLVTEKKFRWMPKKTKPADGPPNQ